jgi:hypothetical protein
VRAVAPGERLCAATASAIIRGSLRRAARWGRLRGSRVDTASAPAVAKIFLAARCLGCAGRQVAGGMDRYQTAFV